MDGAKNAVLPAMAASLLTEEPIILERVPMVQDVKTMGALLESLGVEITREPFTLKASGPLRTKADYDLVRRMRASILVLGPLLAREGQCQVALPGGCAIGVRPVDLHLEGLRKMGAKILLKDGYIVGKVKRLKGCHYTFPRKTVGGTENLMMAATLAEGRTILENVAQEPEVHFLKDSLTRMGASIQWEGDRLIIEGVSRLHGGNLTILPDRIELGTYAMMAAACPGSQVVCKGGNPQHLWILWETFEKIGVPFKIKGDEVTVFGREGLKAYSISTAPYPGFPTDLQAQFMALMTQAEGVAEIEETIFENRFHHVAELCRMGADIHISSKVATVQGPTPLMGAQVMASDLRASASLVLAALCAKGKTTISRIYHLDRGYTSMEEKLKALKVPIHRLRIPLV